MTRHSRLLLALTIVSLVLLAHGVQGGGSIGADRQLRIPTAEDSVAFVGIHPVDPVLSPGRHEAIRLLLIENNLPGNDYIVEASLEVDESNPTPPNILPGTVSIPDPIHEAAPVTGDVVCGGSPNVRVSPERIEFSITVDTDHGTTVAVNRTVTVRCAGPEGGRE